MTAKSWHKCRWLPALACALLVSAAHAQQELNPLARPGNGVPSLLGGVWNGADLERRTHCSSPQNEGTHGTYAEYVVNADLVNHTIGITQNGVTGLRCTYLGDFREEASGLQWSGNYSCTDGKRGSFQSQGFLITRSAMSIRLAIKLDTTETCDIEAVLGGSRI